MRGLEVIVDEHDTIIGSKNWRNVQYEDIYRVSSLWLSDTRSGDALLAQRKWTKKNAPGKWGSAAAGTIEDGETYESNMIKETEEELGLTDLALTTGPKEYIDDGNHKFFCQWFLATVDKDDAKIKIQEDEVEAVKWISKSDLLKDVAENPQNYTPSMGKNLKALGVM